jgi:hypothetical protein
MDNPHRIYEARVVRNKETNARRYFFAPLDFESHPHNPRNKINAANSHSIYRIWIFADRRIKKKRRPKHQCIKRKEYRGNSSSDHGFVFLVVILSGARNPSTSGTTY